MVVDAERASIRHRIHRSLMGWDYALHERIAMNFVYQHSRRWSKAHDFHIMATSSPEDYHIVMIFDEFDNGLHYTNGIN